MTYDRLWRVNAVLTVILALVTGFQYARGEYLLAMVAAFSLGFAVAMTVISVLLDIHEVRFILDQAGRDPFRRD